MPKVGFESPKMPKKLPGKWAWRWGQKWSKAGLGTTSTLSKKMNFIKK